MVNTPIVKDGFLIRNRIIIRNCTAEDVTILKQLCCQTFFDSWGSDFSVEDMNSYMNENFTEQKIKEEIEGDLESYHLAFCDAVPVGYIKLRRNYKTPMPTNLKVVELQRVYVLDKYKGKGIGSDLIKYVLNIVTEEKFEVIWLGVWEKNSNAINLYKKFGFEVCGGYSFKLGNDSSFDLVMKKNLSKQ